MLLKLLASAILILGFTTSERIQYDNYSLYKIQPQNKEDVQFLQQLQKENPGFEFWKPPSKVGQYVSVISPPEFKGDLEHTLSKRSIYSELVLENIQEAFDAELYSRRKRDTSGQMYWTNYHTLSELYDWFQYLAQAYSGIATVVVGGQTHEGRNITGIRISRGSSGQAFFLTAGEIGADWLSPTVVAYIAEQLVKGEDPQALQATQDFDWYIFPAINVDGVEYSMNFVRTWMKNRRPITSTQVGVDLSRNWNSQWGVNGASFIAADNNYVGLGPFSEPETRTFSNYIESFGQRIVGFLNFKSFGQRLLIPFANTTDHLHNYNDMIFIGRRAMGALSVRYNTHYQVGTSAEVSDGSTGNMADWVKHRFNPPVVATFLLRDEGAWGFILPVQQVEPSCLETYDSVLAVVREGQFINVL